MLCIVSMPIIGLLANCAVWSTWLLSCLPVSLIRAPIVAFTPFSMSITWT